MKRTTVIIAALLTIFAVTASATLLQYYGRITGTVNVKQSVVFSDGTTEKTYSFEGDAVAGDTYMDTFRIKNRANVPATVKFVDTVNGANEVDGITTKYYKLAEQTYVIEEGKENYNGPEVDLDDPDDAYDTLGNINLRISYEDSKVVFTITTPTDLIGSTPETYSGSVAFIFDADADGATDWQVLYEPGSGNFNFDGNWGYEEALESGANPTPRTFIDATTVSGLEVARDGDNFIVKVDFDKLGGLGSEYRFGFYISVLTEYWGGIPGGAGQVMIFFPSYDYFDWADTRGYETFTVGTEIQEGETFTIGAGETVTFVIVNEFDIALRPATYTITTYLEPVVEP